MSTANERSAVGDRPDSSDRPGASDRPDSPDTPGRPGVGIDHVTVVPANYREDPHTRTHAE